MISGCPVVEQRKGWVVKGLVLAVACVAVASSARADVARGDLAERAYFAGVVLRSDNSTQRTRVGGGVRFGRLSWNVVVDPFGYHALSEQSDTDAFAEYELAHRWSILGGWRVTSAPVLGSRYRAHKPFVGVSAPLPAVLWGHVRMRLGCELAVTAFKHGDHLPTVGVWNEPMSETTDGVSWGISLRAELARGF